MKNMKRNVLLIPFFAVLTLMFVSFAAADEITGDIETTFNELSLDSGITVAGMVSEIVPVRVTFTADTTLDDVKVKLEMEGHREEISASTDRFDVVEGNTYTKLLSLRLPSDVDDMLNEDFTLYVEVVSSSDRSEETYTISLQRESYTLEILSIDHSSKVSAGDVFPVSVVARNNGFNDADDVFVVATIPSLGISARGYMGDLVSIEDDDNGEDDEDAASKTVYLKVPENAESGVYEMVIEVYDDDSEISATQLVSVGNAGSTTILAAQKNKVLSAGETTTYELVIVNSANNVRVFNINSVSGDALSVSAPSAVAVGPDSTETVSILVTPASNADVGKYTFSVDVDGKQTVFGADVTGTNVSVSLVAWTVVLVVVFVVLLAVLLVLVTRKEKPIEEVETSYY